MATHWPIDLLTNYELITMTFITSFSNEQAFTNEYTLVFGRDIPSGGTVSDAELADFLTTVDSVLECYTLAFFQGVWRGTKEDSFSISVCGNASDVQLLSSLRVIAEHYKAKFKQDSVLFKSVELSNSAFI